ncbi:hypothetical protein B4U80_06503, partial [Leptotrombidium deliense]
MNDDKRKLLKNIYYNTRDSASFSSAEKLFQKAKLYSPTIKLKEVKEWLSGELTYTLHKPIRKNFKRNKIVARGVDDQWQADLVDVGKFDTQNDGNKFILTAIDVFSKFAFAEPIKNKNAVNVAKA